MDYERSALNRMQEAQQEQVAQEAEGELEGTTPAAQIVNGGPEAHRAALSRSVPSAQRAQIVGGLQRKFGNSYVQRMIQRAMGPEGGPLDGETANRINSKRGGGSSLDAGVRREMEQSMGADFSGVKVHSDTESHELNRQLGANAFTTGSDIFMGAGKSAGDKDLLSHELTHVVQQGGNYNGGPMTVGPAGDSYEQEAEQTSASIAGGAAGPQRQLADVQRDGAESGEAEEEENVQMQRVDRQIDEEEEKA